MMAKSVISDLIQIFKSSVSAVLPENLIRKSITYSPVSQQLTILGESYNVHNKNIYVVGFGKAVQHMANEIEIILNNKITRGIISIPTGSFNQKSTNRNITYYEGAKNNLPDVNAESTARSIKDLVTKLDKDDLLLVLISGGGSALLPLPKDPISLEEKTWLIKKLSYSGADITELNSVRKQISELKGGQLAIKAQPADVVSLILSDIVGDPLDLIASGPTTENQDDNLKAINIIKKYKLFEDLPQSIKMILTEDNTLAHFPKNKVKNHIVASNKLSIAAALNEAEKLDYLPMALSNIVTGDVKIIAKGYAVLSKIFCQFLNGKLDIDTLKGQIKSLSIPGTNMDIIEQLIGNSSSKCDLCIIFGGEITVEVRGAGKGGRNQQLALEFSNYIHNMIHEFKGFDIYLLSAGTDGVDGPTDAAGAIGYINLISDSLEEGIDINKYLSNNDSYNFYKSYKNGNLHVMTGHTNTNVMDIHLLLLKRIK